MTLLNILRMKKMQSINHSKCNSHPPLTVGRSIKCSRKPTLLLREHVIKGTSCSKSRNRLHYKFSPSYHVHKLQLACLAELSSILWYHFCLRFLLFCFWFCCFVSPVLPCFPVYCIVSLLTYWPCGSRSWKVIAGGQFSIVVVLLQHNWLKGDKSKSSLSEIQGINLNFLSISKVENLCPCKME